MTENYISIQKLRRPPPYLGLMAVQIYKGLFSNNFNLITAIQPIADLGDALLLHAVDREDDLAIDQFFPEHIIANRGSWWVDAVIPDIAGQTITAKVKRTDVWNGGGTSLHLQVAGTEGELHFILQRGQKYTMRVLHRTESDTREVKFSKPGNIKKALQVPWEYGLVRSYSTVPNIL